eukprot:UN02468
MKPVNSYLYSGVVYGNNKPCEFKLEVVRTEEKRTLILCHRLRGCAFTMAGFFSELCEMCNFVGSDEEEDGFDESDLSASDPEEEKILTAFKYVRFNDEDLKHWLADLNSDDTDQLEHILP